MGIYDREYYRDEDQPRGFRVPSGGHSMVIILIVINVALFVLNMFSGAENKDWLTNTLALKPESLAKPWMWWEFLTCGFAHASTSGTGGLPMHILLNMFMLWMFGRDVEQIYGRWEFLRVYLLAIVLGSVIWALRIYFTTDGTVNYSLVGASGATAAILILYICHFPKRTLLLMFVIPMPAWVLGVLFILIQIFGLRSNDHIAYDVHLVGIGFALAYFKLGWNLGRFLPGEGRIRDWRLGLKRLKPGAPQLKVHDPQVEDRYREMDDEADRLLDKVHREGEESLTPKERRLLEDYSRRMRQKHR